jgi:hypothetical protein
VTTTVATFGSGEIAIGGNRILPKEPKDDLLAILF